MQQRTGTGLELASTFYFQQKGSLHQCLMTAPSKSVLGALGPLPLLPPPISWGGNRFLDSEQSLGELG